MKLVQNAFELGLGADAHPFGPPLPAGQCPLELLARPNQTAHGRPILAQMSRWGYIPAPISRIRSLENATSDVNS
jgi:hypothetical protein